MASKKKNPQPRKSKLLFFILALAFLVRTYKFKAPLADWHSFRQADTASVAREYTKNGINFLIPKYQDLSNIQSGSENPEGYRMVEFPVVSGLVAFLYNLLPKNLELHVLYRLSSILFSVGSAYLLYRLVRLLESEKLALLSATVFAVLPFNIFYSRAVLPEISLVFFSLLQLYASVSYFKSKNKSISNPHFWTAAVSGAIAMLIKPYALVLMVPIVYQGLKSLGIKIIKDKKVYLYLLIVLLPYILWREWIRQFPEGIPDYLWLLNGNNIRFKGAFFRWIFADRIGKLILGYWGVFLLGLGFIRKSKSSLFSWWLVSILIYLFTFATGNVQHDYYQIFIIPVISVYVAKGILFLIEAPKRLGISHGTSHILLTTVILFSLAFSWYEVKEYFNINNPAIVEAGKYIDEHIPDDALVIAPYMGDTAFLYQTNRRGWPIGWNIDERISQGADYYVTTSLDSEAQDLMEIYQVVETNDRFTVIDLSMLNALPQVVEEPTPSPEEIIDPAPDPKLKPPSWPPGKGVKKK